MMSWERLRPGERLALGALIVVIIGVTLPRLPPGICYGDWGDLQLAAATLGIAHPPGYPGYASLGFLFTLIPFFDPAHLVTLACWGSGLLALTLCVLMQVRLGVSGWIATALALALTAHPRVWTSLIAPEVYMPSLALLAGAAYLVTKFACRGSRKDLYVAALLLGIALGNRTPAVLTVPFFVAGWWCACTRSEQRRGRGSRSLLVATLLAALPGLYSLGYLWVRDTPTAPYNYLEQYNADERVLPESSAGPAAKVHRIVWLMSGAQFHDLLGNTWRGVCTKLRWVRHEMLPDPFVSLMILPAVVLTVAGFIRHRLPALAALLGVLTLSGLGMMAWYTLKGNVDEGLDLLLKLLPLQALMQTVLGCGILAGIFLAFRRCPTAAVLLAGMGLCSVVYVCSYRISGNAADILPLLYAAVVLVGVAISVVFSRAASQRRMAAAMAIMVATIGVTILHVPYRYATELEADALPFLKEADMTTLPLDAVICTSWPHAPPLWYARRFLTPRPDIEVINASDTQWQRLVADHLHRPIFGTYQNEEWRGPSYWVPFRNLWRLESARPDEG